MTGTIINPSVPCTSSSSPSTSSPSSSFPPLEEIRNNNNNNNNEVPLLREWNYSRQTETPVAVPLNTPLCSLPPSAAFVATCVTTHLLKISDQWRFSNPCLQQELQNSNNNNSSNNGKENVSDNVYRTHDHVDFSTRACPSTSIRGGLHQENHHHHPYAEDNIMEEDWEVIDELLVIQGELVEDYTEEELNDSSVSTISYQDSSIKVQEQDQQPRHRHSYLRRLKRRKNLNRKGCNAAIQEWFYKQKVRMSKRRAKRRMDRFFKEQEQNQQQQEQQQQYHQQEESSIPSVPVIATSHVDNMISSSSCCSSMNSFSSSPSHQPHHRHHHHQGLSDRSIDNYLQSIRNKTKQEEIAMRQNYTRRIINGDDDEDTKIEDFGDVEMNSSFMSLTTAPDNVVSAAASASASSLSSESSNSVKEPKRPSFVCIKQQQQQQHQEKEGANLRNVRMEKRINLSSSKDEAPMEYPVKVQKRDSLSYSVKDADRKRNDAVSQSLQQQKEYDDEIVDKEVTVNDTLKVIFVGMEEMGKTSIVNRLCFGKDREVPCPENRTIGVDCYEWDPKGESHFDTRIEVESDDDDPAISVSSDMDVKFKILDFTGKSVHHATQELFFSPSALYVIVWDMGVKNKKIKKMLNEKHEEMRFYDNDFSEQGLEALNKDIDEKVQFWVDCIQKRVPGAAILPIGSFSDECDSDYNAELRCKYMRERLLYHEQKNFVQNSKSCIRSKYLQKEFMRPKLILGEENNMIRVSSEEYSGFNFLKQKIINVATGRDQGGWKYKLFDGHIGARIPHMGSVVKNLIQDLRNKRYIVVEWDFFYKLLKEKGIENEDDIKEALHFLTNVGELVYFGGSKGVMTEKVEESSSSQLSQFIFLDPKWLVKAIACIFRHDLSYRIKEIHKSSPKQILPFDNVTNPTITYEDACSLWRPLADSAMKKMKYTSIDTFYKFLKRLLVHFSVFVPIDLRIGGVEQQHIPDHSQSFFLPSLLGSVEPDDDFFRYKPKDASITTICNSWLFPDSIPPGIMERIMASSLKTVYSDAMELKVIMCWRSAFYTKISYRGCEVEIFVRMAEQSSNLCIASKTMSPGMKRLTISGQGSSLESGKFIWNCGYRRIKQAIQNVIEEYGGLDYEEQAICPKCLEKFPIKEAGFWGCTKVEHAVQNSEEFLFCQNAHRMDTHVLKGDFSSEKLSKQESFDVDDDVNVNDLLDSFVLVCPYNTKEKTVTSSGSGFIADGEQGLIVTAAHTVMCIEGENMGKELGDKIIIGVIPKTSEKQSNRPAVFRYIAQIVAIDSSIQTKKVCTMDACVLQIVSKLEKDSHRYRNIEMVEQHMTKRLLREEHLNSLEVSEYCEIEEHVRIIGFPQDGKHLVRQGSNLFRNVGVTKGFVNSHFDNDDDDLSEQKGLFSPQNEIVVTGSSTFGGESGGPCINQQGKVIGILSRSHGTRNYLVPTIKWMRLLKDWKILKKMQKGSLTLSDIIASKQ